jgi:DNA-binding MarR family transcriptional regulator
MAELPGPVPTIINVFRRAAALMIDELVARLDAAGFAGLTPAHSAVLENLDPGGTRLTDLAARARMTRQSMTELVSVLEQRGYLERQPDPADRRARIVRLTPTGRQLVRQAIKETASIEAEWRSQLARHGLKGDIVAVLTEALATARPGHAARTASSSRHGPVAST